MSFCITSRRPGTAPALTSFPSVASLFSDLLNDPFFSEARGPGPAAAGAGTLAVDVLEDEQSLIVRASLPGYRKEDVEVQVHDHVLAIKAERSEEKEESNERYHRRERRFGSVSRLIALPETVTGEDVKAELKEGVLTLRLAKTPKEQPRKVQIA